MTRKIIITTPIISTTYTKHLKKGSKLGSRSGISSKPKIYLSLSTPQERNSQFARTPISYRNLRQKSYNKDFSPKKISPKTIVT
jgi:hypothetical protein